MLEDESELLQGDELVVADGCKGSGRRWIEECVSEFLGSDGGIVGGGHARHANVGRKKFDGVDNSFSAGF